jgi:CIC family chloride channel protein
MGRIDFDRDGTIVLHSSKPCKPRYNKSMIAAAALTRQSLSALQQFFVTHIRNNDLALVIWGAMVGVTAAAGEALLSGGVRLLHTVLYGVSLTGHLSGSGPYEWRVLLPVLGFGGLGVGVVSWGIRRLNNRSIVDPIEANALYGGRMSIRDSAGLALLTVLSGGVGASVGLEAAFTQLGGSFGSRLGRLLYLRRADVRTLVGCGAGAAIAAAFHAPLTGAFYAFELILGSYAPAALGAVAAASLAGTLTARALTGTEPIFRVGHSISLQPFDYGLCAALGIGAALLSILVMRGVTTTEAVFRKASIPAWARPALGGLILAALAFAYPQVLGSGHGAILSQLRDQTVFPVLLGMLAAKAAASAISIGAGFRGGLFSAALFLGSLFGGVVAAGLQASGIEIDPLAYTLAGMGAVAAGIIGAPVTMILLVLETTGDFSATLAVMIAVLTCSISVRHFFGYSFATWRFHLRGLPIASPVDIGWVRDFSVAKLMRPDPPLIGKDATVAQLKRKFPPGSIKFLFAVDNDNRFAGAVDLMAAYQATKEEQPIADFTGNSEFYLRPSENGRAALARFREAALETLPVVEDGPDGTGGTVIGMVTEYYALRRYTQELERRRAADITTAGIFSPES